MVNAHLDSEEETSHTAPSNEECFLYRVYIDVLEF
jgi:hypothetical protein